MIDNLRLTTDRNTEQDWLKTNLARFTGMLQGQRDLGTVPHAVSELCRSSMPSKASFTRWRARSRAS